MPDYEGGQQGGEQERKPVNVNDPWEVGQLAAREGLEAAIAQVGANQPSAVNDPDMQRRQEMFIRGYGAAPEQMMRQALDKVDPDRKMHAGERNILALATVYRYYMDEGQPQKAQAAAASMMQYYQQSFQQFAA